MPDRGQGRDSRRTSLLSNMSRTLSRGRGSTGSITSIVARSSSGVYYEKPVKKTITKKQIETFKEDVNIDEHALDFDELQIRYDTNLERGLSKAKADDLLVQNGPNCLVPPKQKSKFLILLKFLFGGFSALIWTGSALSFIEYGITTWHTGVSHMETIYLGIVLAVEATLTGFFAFYVQQTHSAIMDSFKKMIPKYATVIRGGEKYNIPSEELVLGDLVEVNSGDMVPADIRILKSHSLKVDNSALTGETNAVPRGSEFTHHDPLETNNLAFYGTNVVEGSGMGLVIRCGDDTVLGHIAGLASSIQKDETLLRKELNFFVKIISLVAFLIGLTLFCLSMGTGYSFFKSFTFFIAIVVANVPEGLPVAFTVCMTLTAKRMAKKNCLIKKFEILETLGACDIICSDKTGVQWLFGRPGNRIFFVKLYREWGSHRTLTQKLMTASHIYYDGSEYDVLNHPGDVQTDSETYCALCDIAILCSRAVFAKSEETMTGDSAVSSQSPTKKKVIGDASEAAILRLMDELYEDIEQRRSECPKVCEIPFTSSNKYQVSIHRLPTSEFLLVMKGAPERVLEYCSTILSDSQVAQNNPQNSKSIRRALQNLGNRGERVLGFADLHLNPKQFPPDYKFDAEKINFPLRGLRFVGLISLTDPPRPEVPQAVAKCRSAGIQVIMITGDHPITATAIARKVGIISINVPDEHGVTSPRRLSSLVVGTKKDSKIKLPRDGSSTKNKSDLPGGAVVVTGGELKEMTKGQLIHIIRSHKEVVFARTNPQQKLQIVEALQGLEKVVAVTGDGVNDSPALKQADIGIAMGISGSDVSKEAADMILLDDNFASIVIGIEEGRLIFDNLKKSIAYELTANIPEIAPFVFLAVLRIPKALSIMSILVINVGTDLWGAISLAYEKPEADIMKRSPRDPKKDKLINSRLISTSYFQIGIIQTVSAFVCYFYILAGHGWHWSKLIGIREKWESRAVNDLEDSYGQEWTYEMREVLTRECISAYFLSIVTTQIGDLLRCKTRRLSIIQQGMTNHVLNTGLFFEISLALFFVFCPKLNKVFDFAPINLVAVAPAIPFSVLIVLYDEFRKYMIRRYPKKWFYNNTYY